VQAIAGMAEGGSVVDPVAGAELVERDREVVYSGDGHGLIRSGGTQLLALCYQFGTVGKVMLDCNHFLEEVRQ